MGTGTWQQQPSANGCQVPVPWQGGALVLRGFAPNRFVSEFRTYPLATLATFSNLFFRVSAP